MKTLFSIITLIVITLALFGGTQQSFAEKQPVISIIYPNSTSIIYGTTVIAYGSYQDFNASATPSIYITLDGVTQVTPYLSGGGWGLEIDNLGGGWHTLVATIADQEAFTKQSVTFLSINGHTVVAKDNLILIKESETCEKLLEIKTVSGCPTLEQLKQYDTSNPHLAGMIIQKSDGTWTRTNPIVKGWWNFINKTGNPVVCVECDYNYAYLGLAQIIVLEPQGFVYASLDPNQNATITDSYTNGTQYFTRQFQDPQAVTTLNINFNRYVSPDCTNANLVFSPLMMSDTLAYMTSGCHKTNLILNKNIVIKPVPFDFEHSTYWKTHEWYNQAKQITQNCINNKCANLNDPNSNPEFSIGR